MWPACTVDSCGLFSSKVLESGQQNQVGHFAKSFLVGESRPLEGSAAKDGRLRVGRLGQKNFKERRSGCFACMQREGDLVKKQDGENINECLQMREAHLTKASGKTQYD